MTKNVTLLGASYPDVPSIILPQTGGGSAEFYADNGSWEGSNFEFVQNLDTLHWNLHDDTSYESWTPSTTQAKIKDVSNCPTTFVADLLNYEYLVKQFVTINYVYTQDMTNTARTICGYTVCNIELFRIPTTEARLSSRSFNSNISGAITQSYFHKYITTANAVRFTNSSSYPLIVAQQTFSLSSSTSDTPTVTVRTPVVNVRCYSSYFPESSAALLDAEKTTIDIETKLYRCPVFDSARSQAMDELYAMYLSDNPPSRNIRQGEEEETEETEEPEER